MKGPGDKKPRELGGGKPERMAGKPRARPLVSSEDHALWDFAARSVKPLRNVRGRVHKVHEEECPETPARRSAGRIVASPQQASGESHKSKPHPVAHEPAHKPAPSLAKFDRGSERRLRSGRSEIEARIDLHGLRQAEAHAALRNFLRSCQARGLSMVLVITGKGAPTGRPDDDEPFWMGGSDGERGVLKRNVPRWLAEPDLRAIVVSYTPAAIRHGGDGALYIHLRRRPGGG